MYFVAHIHFKTYATKDSLNKNVREKEEKKMKSTKAETVKHHCHKPTKIFNKYSY